MQGVRYGFCVAGDSVQKHPRRFRRLALALLPLLNRPHRQQIHGRKFRLGETQALTKCAHVGLRRNEARCSKLRRIAFVVARKTLDGLIRKRCDFCPIDPTGTFTNVLVAAPHGTHRIGNFSACLPITGRRTGRWAGGWGGTLAGRGRVDRRAARCGLRHVSTFRRRSEGAARDAPRRVARRRGST